MKKLNYIFVGGFKDMTKDGHIGGILIACKTILESKLSEYINWTLIDSTQQSSPPPPTYYRLVLALKRLFLFLLHINKPNIHGALIYTSSGFSFAEKGIMVLLSRLFKKKAILCPQSGHIIDDLNPNRFMGKYIRFIVRNSSILVCQSDYWKKIYQDFSNLPNDRFVVIPNMINVSQYSRCAKQKEPSTDVKILFLNSIERSKGIYDLINAIKLYKIKLQNCHFFICGHGSELANIKELVNNLKLSNLVSFKGVVHGPEKIDILHQSDIFILPSYREGLPNSILESMAAGLAVITTKVGGIPDVIENDKTGKLINPGDVESLGKAIVELSNDRDLRESLGMNASEHINKHYNADELWLRLYNVLNF